MSLGIERLRNFRGKFIWNLKYHFESTVLYVTIDLIAYPSKGERRCYLLVTTDINILLARLKYNLRRSVTCSNSYTNWLFPVAWRGI